MFSTNQRVIEIQWIGPMLAANQPTNLPPCATGCLLAMRLPVGEPWLPGSAPRLRSRITPLQDYTDTASHRDFITNMVTSTNYDKLNTSKQW